MEGSKEREESVNYLSAMTLNTLQIIQTEGWEARENLACFDLDCTIAFSCRGYNDKEIMLLPDSNNTLCSYHSKGYSVVVISNQKGKGERAYLRLLQVSKLLDCPVLLIAATGVDEYRKPATGMWNYLTCTYYRKMKISLAF